METALQQFKNFIRYWWVMLIFAVIILAAGVATFVWPFESYPDMVITIPVLMLISGIIDLWMAFSDKSFGSRGWLTATGVLEVLFGILLFSYLSHPGLMMPYFLGFWLLLRGMGQFGIAGEIRALGVASMGWSRLTSGLLILAALAVLFAPMFGLWSVMMWMGAALMFAGISLAAYSVDLQAIRKEYQQAFAELYI